MGEFLSRQQSSPADSSAELEHTAAQAEPRPLRESAIPLSPTQARAALPAGTAHSPANQPLSSPTSPPTTSTQSSSSLDRPATFGPSPSSFPFPPFHVQPPPAASTSSTYRIAPPRPPRPEDSSSSRLYNPGWKAPFPSAQTASTSWAVPPTRPHRDRNSPMFEAVAVVPPTPDRPDLGKGKGVARVDPVEEMYEDEREMGFPRSPSIGGGAAGELDEGTFAPAADLHDERGSSEQEELYDRSYVAARIESPVDSLAFSPSEEMDVAAFLAHADPPSPLNSASSRTSPAVGAGQRRGSFASSHKSKRKPVPKFLPSPSSAEGHNSARLSLGGFEALLVRGSTSKRSSQEREDPAPQPPAKRTAAMVRGTSNQSTRSNAAGSSLPGEVFSPRLGLGLDARGIRAREERRRLDEQRQRAIAAGYPGNLEQDEIAEEEPERPRAMKNVSWSDRMKQAEWEEQQRQAQLAAGLAVPASRLPISPDNAYSIGRTPDFKPLPLNTTPYPGRQDSPSRVRWSWGRPAPARDDGSLERVVVVPSSGWNEPENSPNPSESPFETVMRPERMHFAAVEYGTLGRVVHLFYPLVVFFHYPATLFLDYNLIYTLVQLAQHPGLPSTASLAARAIPIPSLHASTAWWTALAVYAACTLLWALAVVLYREVGLGYINIWGSGSVDIGRVYKGSSAFNIGCIQSFQYFSFLWRVRLAPFQRHADLSVPGESFLDGVLESCGWYIQNWPTALLLLPRAGISLTILLLYGTTAYGTASSSADSARDSAYFNSNGVLTGFAAGILMANLAWTAWRVFLVISSAVGLFILDGPCSRRSEPYSAHEHPSREHLTSDMSPNAGFSPATPQTRRSSAVEGLSNWRVRRTRRLRAGILLCLKSITPSSHKYPPAASHSAALPSPYTNKLRKPNSPQNTIKRQEHALKRGHSVTKRSPDFAVRAMAWGDDDSQDEKSRETADYAAEVPTLPKHGWAGIGTFVAPSPTITPASKFFTSPESTDTAATSQFATTPAATGMHKRIRSLPLEQQEELIPSPAEPISGAQLVRAASVSTVNSNRPLPALPLHERTNSGSSVVEKRASVSTNGGRRTPIVIAPRGMTPTHAKRRSNSSLLGAPKPSAETPPTTPSESVSTPLDEWPFSPVGPATVRTAHLEHFQRQARSEKLLSEVKRLGEQEEAVRAEERRLAMVGSRAQGLRPISETSMEGLTSPAMMPLPGTPQHAEQDHLEKVLESPTVGLTDEQLFRAAANRRRRASEQSLLTGEEPDDWRPTEPGAEGLLLPPFNFRLSAIGGTGLGVVPESELHRERAQGDVGLQAGEPSDGAEYLIGRPQRMRTITAESALTDVTFASTAAESFESNRTHDAHDAALLTAHLASAGHGTPARSQLRANRMSGVHRRREWAIHHSPANTFGQKGPDSALDH